MKKLLIDADVKLQHVRAPGAKRAPAGNKTIQIINHCVCPKCHEPLPALPPPTAPNLSERQQIDELLGRVPESWKKLPTTWDNTRHMRVRFMPLFIQMCVERMMADPSVSYEALAAGTPYKNEPAVRIATLLTLRTMLKNKPRAAIEQINAVVAKESLATFEGAKLDELSESASAVYHGVLLMRNLRDIEKNVRQRLFLVDHALPGARKFNELLSAVLAMYSMIAD